MLQKYTNIISIAYPVIYIYIYMSLNHLVALSERAKDYLRPGTLENKGNEGFSGFNLYSSI